jgi:hypothetical protein
MKKKASDIFRLNSELWQWSSPHSLEWQFHHPAQNISVPDSGEPVIIRVRNSTGEIIAAQLIIREEGTIRRRVISPSKRRKYSFEYGGISINEETIIKFTESQISDDRGYPWIEVKVRIFKNNIPHSSKYESLIINPTIRKFDKFNYQCVSKSQKSYQQYELYQPIEWEDDADLYNHELPTKENEEDIHIRYNQQGHANNIKIEPQNRWNDYRRGLSSTEIRLKYSGDQIVEIDTHVYIDNILTSENYQEKVVFNFNTLGGKLILGPGPKSAIVTRWDDTIQIFNYQYKDAFLSQIEIVDTDAMEKEKYFIEYTILDRDVVNLKDF